MTAIAVGQSHTLWLVTEVPAGPSCPLSSFLPPPPPPGSRWSKNVWVVLTEGFLILCCPAKPAHPSKPSLHVTSSRKPPLTAWKNINPPHVGAMRDGGFRSQTASCESCPTISPQHPMSKEGAGNTRGFPLQNATQRGQVLPNGETQRDHEGVPWGTVGDGGGGLGDGSAQEGSVESLGPGPA